VGVYRLERSALLMPCGCGNVPVQVVLLDVEERAAEGLAMARAVLAQREGNAHDAAHPLHQAEAHTLIAVRVFTLQKCQCQ
jgi:hypothetical protein